METWKQSGLAAAMAVVAVVVAVGLQRWGLDQATHAPTTTVTATSGAVASATPSTLVKGLTGVFDEPRLAPPDRVVTPPTAPPSPFSSWDGNSTVIYDVKTGKELNLGPGGVPSFSPDGTRAVWIAGDPTSPNGGEARLINLATESVRSLGPGTGLYPRFLDNNTVAFILPGPGNRVVSVNLQTGVQTDVSGNDVDQRAFERTDAIRMTTPDGYRVSWEPNPAAGQLPRGVSQWGNVRVTDTRSGQVVLTFDAFDAAPAGAGHIVVASQAVGATVNLFLVDIATGQAQFLATTRWSGNFPLAADDRHIAWINDYCGDPRGNLELYDRVTKVLTEVNGVHSYVQLTPSGLLALGEFGARSLMDPSSFATVATLPAGGDVAWSDDYRYAAHGVWGGHGGLC